MKMAKKQTAANYTLLAGDNYVSLAKTMTALNAVEHKLRKKLKALDHEVHTAQNQLNLYAANVFYKRYNCKHYSILFTAKDARIYREKDVRQAMAVAAEQNDGFMDDEYEALFGTGVCTYAQFLPKPIHTVPVNTHQCASFRALAEAYDLACRQYTFISAKLTDTIAQYERAASAVVEQAEEDKRYNFDADIHKMLIIQDKLAGHPQIIYCTKADATSLLRKRGDKQTYIDTIAEQIHAN